MAGLNSKLSVISGCTKPMKRRKNARNQGNKLRPDSNRSRKDALVSAKEHTWCIAFGVLWGLRSRTTLADVYKIKLSECHSVPALQCTCEFTHGSSFDWLVHPQKKSGKKFETTDIGCSEYWQKYFGVGRSVMTPVTIWNETKPWDGRTSNKEVQPSVGPCLWVIQVPVSQQSKLFRCELAMVAYAKIIPILRTLQRTRTRVLFWSNWI